MSWHAIAAVLAFAAPLAAALAPAAQAESSDKPRVSGPVVHDNLAVYFVHGPSTPGPVPLTLGEAIAAGKVTVHETGRVSQLAIENASDEAVFVQAGDIVKGGRQDRVLTVSFLVPPKSGRVPIGAYCVERGRWTARGIEDAKRFASSEKSVPSRAAKLAILSPSIHTAGLGAPAMTSRPSGPERAHVVPNQQRILAPPAGASDRLAAQTGEVRSAAQDSAEQEARQARLRRAIRNFTTDGSRQSEVWALVDSAQRKLSANVGANVSAAASATSLQLALENKRLAALRETYTNALKPAGTAAADIVGYVFAINGKIVSGDVYPSTGLFRKMWSKQIEAGATEAIAEKTTGTSTTPSVEQVQTFLAQAETGNTTLSKLDGNSLVREARDTDNALFLETRQSAGGFIHRSYLARR
jgi:hypothetical protein